MAHADGLHAVAVVVPALDAAPTIVSVVRGAQRHCPRVIVVDDGSTDATAALAAAAGAYVVRHPRNLGKGAALRSGLLAARTFGASEAITLDADGQHPPTEIPKLLFASQDRRALVLGVRDLVAAGAPSKNRWSNGFANWFLSHATHVALADTQCGMRRYPIGETLALGVRENGFGFETEVLLRAIHAKLPIIEVPVSVLYPSNRTTHFDAARDPWRIVGRVLVTMAETFTRP